MVKTSDNIIDLRSLNLEELSGVVSLYPWFALARKELCERMAALGEGGWSDERFAEEALYMGSRKIIYGIVQKAHRARPREEKPVRKAPAGRQVFIVGGDYFSPAQYAKVKMEDADIFASFSAKASPRPEAQSAVAPVESYEDFCTEPLAKVYLDQGYKDKAKEIYGKLSLLYPEKSVYFASLIEKIDNS